MNYDVKIKIVEACIFHRKCVDVTIRMPQTIDEVIKLATAYEVAVAWFNKNGSIEFVR